MVGHKLYVTGGVGSRHLAEAFGQPYELPNDLAYCETCAAIASILWSWRMLLATGQARFADLIERTLHNAVLAGVSLDGERYFYVNPLASNGGPSTSDAAAAGARSGTWSRAARRTSCGSWRRSATTSRRATRRACRSTSTRRRGSRRRAADAAPR